MKSMLRFCLPTVAVSLFCASLVPAAPASASVPKIAIVKADDLRRANPQWLRFIAESEARGVKVSIGIICDSLAGAPEDYVAWLRDIDRAGRVEFWHHGWDHRRWTDEQGKQLREFQGTGYAHQKKHYEEAKALMAEVFGRPPLAFGAPFNAVDADTFTILNADPDMRLYFGPTPTGLIGKLFVPMSIRGEHDGTGKPNFEKFRAEYEAKPGLTLLAVQVHPNNFGDEQFAEYGKIIDFLLSEGWSFILPSDFVIQNGEQKTASSL